MDMPPLPNGSSVYSSLNVSCHLAVMLSGLTQCWLPSAELLDDP